MNLNRALGNAQLVRNYLIWQPTLYLLQNLQFPFGDRRIENAVLKVRRVNWVQMSTSGIKAWRK